MISEFIFYSENGSKEEKNTYIEHKIHIRELLNDNFNREVLASTLMELRRDVSGQALKQLIDLYKNLGLHLDAYKKLESWRWEMVSKGILELSHMQVTESYQYIVRFINDKRSVIRKQAEIATITLKNEGISYFMDTTKYKISEWQQLSLLEILRNNKDFKPPQFKTWLTSKNKHVVLFALRLIKHYNQNDARASLIELLKHRNDQIKLEAIECLKIFNVVEAKDMLKKVFWRCSTEVKISILGAISLLGDQGDIVFLRKIERKKLDFTVKSKALSAINTIVPETIMPTEGIENVTNNEMPDDIIEKKEIEEFNDESPIEHREETSKEIFQEELNIPDSGYESESKIPSEKEVHIEVGQENLDFLPIVVSASEENILYNAIGSDAFKDEIELKNKEEIEGFESSMFDLSETALDFLPIVVSNEPKEEKQEDNTDFDIVNNEINTTIMDREEKESDNPEFEFTVQDLTFLPIVVEEELKNIIDNDEVKFPKPEEEVENDFNETIIEEGKTVIEEILENNLANEQSMNKELIDEEDNVFIDWPISQEFQQDNVNQAPKEDIESILSLIPKPYEFDNETAVLIRLLSDIEELGDHREIPFLLDLLLEESRPLIQERIQNVVYTIERRIDPKVKSVRHSIFEELFHSCDTESKLILLDEIVAVGDNKEISFLTGLLKDPNIEISAKAESTLAQLKERLSEKTLKEMDVETNVLSDSHENSLVNEDDDLLIFTDEFALIGPGGNAIKNMSQSFLNKNQNFGLLFQLRSIPNRLLEKLNG
ncbi:hypothetical protein R3X28_08215 [Maribacter sp. TH_r10]|uniref:HEAT repeat domain-containing protein n=1 Tax=Maribacter sp. TH_r10 TaxID=3082086 RepID=UPI00295350E9|nr:hypothetical protein [Maribacter sp. TH_r10]MDV7138857.1 hypothetical protein [Maribacter sp. TH_r10]